MRHDMYNEDLMNLLYSVIKNSPWNQITHCITHTVNLFVTNLYRSDTISVFEILHVECSSKVHEN